MERKIVRAASYARTSLILNQDPNLQLVAIRNYAAARGIEIVAEYKDQMSGATERRPGLDNLLDDAKSGRFDVVICAAFDRIGRSSRHLLDVLDQLNRVGVALISLRENLDMSTPTGRMIYTVLAAISQLERETIRERVRTALAAKKVIAQRTGNGWRCGRPPKSEEVRSEILRLRSEGKSIRQIERDLAGRAKRTFINDVIRAATADRKTSG